MKTPRLLTTTSALPDLFAALTGLTAAPLAALLFLTTLAALTAVAAGTAASAHAGAEEKRGGTNGEGKQDTRERKTK